MSQPSEEARWQTYPTEPERPGPGQEADPATPLPVPVAPSAPLPGPNLTRPGFTPHDPLQLSAGGGGIKKDGVWTVPPYLSLHGDVGSIRLDFRRAQMTSQVTWVQISGGAGTMVLIVPEGWAVQLDRVTAGMGTRKSNVAEEPTPGQPVLVLSGSLGLGTLKIRYPNYFDERRLVRMLQREQRRTRAIGG